MIRDCEMPLARVLTLASGREFDAAEEPPSRKCTDEFSTRCVARHSEKAAIPDAAVSAVKND